LNKPFYILFFLFVSLSFGEGWGEVSAQTNLIYNGDFELYDTCPTNFSQPLNYQINTCLGWYSPTYGTSDYFNSCNTGVVSVPSNIFGYQNAFNGYGYMGLYVNDHSPIAFQCLNGEWSSFYREYIQTKLISTLKADRKYKFIFYISLADTVGAYATKNIGALFTKDSIGFNCYKPIIATPQIISENFVTNSIVWTKVEGEFIAEGGEKFLTIGNFSDTLNFENDTLCVRGGDWCVSGDGLSYYYVDGLFLEEIELYIPNIFSPNNDAINDLFKIKGLDSGDNVLIFNRWGIKVYEFSGIHDGWDGRNISGIECSEGVYYYIITRKEKENLKGFIQLIR